MLTAYDLYYEHFIKKGYQHFYAQICAENEVRKITEEANDYPPFEVDVPGVGRCRYTGD